MYIYDNSNTSFLFVQYFSSQVIGNISGEPGSWGDCVDMRSNGRWQSTMCHYYRSPVCMHTPSGNFHSEIQLKSLMPHEYQHSKTCNNYLSQH